MKRAVQYWWTVVVAVVAALAMVAGGMVAAPSAWADETGMTNELGTADDGPGYADDELSEDNADAALTDEAQTDDDEVAAGDDLVQTYDNVDDDLAVTSDDGAADGDDTAADGVDDGGAADGFGEADSTVSSEEGIQTLSSDAATASVTGVTLGSGTTVYTTDTINQRDVRNKALETVKKWRQDALNDTRIKFYYKGAWRTIADYLDKAGISQNDYLNPKWSNAMERIALQRIVEAYDLSSPHYRLNGDYYSTVQYQGHSSSTEILAWGNTTWVPDITAMIDKLWANEKEDYVLELAGRAHDQTGHYKTLVDPKFKSYGFAMASSIYGYGASGEASTVVQDDTSATNLKGTYTFSMNVSNAILNQGVTWSSVPSVMGVGETASPYGTLKYRSPRVQFRGNWTSSNTAVISTSGNKLTAKAKGTAKVSVTMAGKTYSWTITVKPKLTRLAGSWRYDTMAKIVQTGGWSTGGTVIVASGENYPDALAASSLAGALNAPIVLTKPDELTSQAAARIKALSPSKIVIVGGTEAISSGVAATLRGYASTVARIAGTERVGTALEIYQQGASVLGAKWGSTAIVATADNFADALSIASYAYKAKAPIFLVKKGALNDNQIAALKQGGFKQVLVVGGTTAVPEAVATQAKKATGVTPTRLAGATRYSTSVAIAKWAVANAGMTVNNSIYATGSNFPDALAAGPVAGKKGGVLLLVKSSDPSAVTSFVSAYSGKVTSAWVAGGTSVVSANAANQIADKLNMKRP